MNRTFFTFLLAISLNPYTAQTMAGGLIQGVGEAVGDVVEGTAQAVGGVADATLGTVEGGFDPDYRRNNAPYYETDVVAAEPNEDLYYADDVDVIVEPGYSEALEDQVTNRPVNVDDIY